MSIELIPLTTGIPVVPSQFLEAVLESRASLQRWMPWCHADYSLQDAERWFEQADTMWRQRTGYPMLIVGSDRRLIGGAGLQDLQLFGKREADIGYWVRATDRGRGVAATAMRTVAAFAFKELGLFRCGIRIQLENRSSRRAAERAGARFEGVVRNGLVVQSVGLDAALYSLLPADLARTWSA